MKLQGNSNRRGFSLLELVLVAVTLAICAAIAAPRYARSVSQYRARCAANRIVADLSLAASNARANSAAQTIAFEIGKNAYELVGMTSTERPTASNTVVLSAEPYLSTLVSCDLGGDANIIFDGYGAPDTGGSIVIRSGEFTKTITVAVGTGRATIQ